MVVIIKNPIRETYNEIESKYDGFCVLVIECENEKQNFGSGKVLAYDKSLPKLIKSTQNLLNDGFGICAYKTFTDIGSLGPIQVVHHV